MHEKAVEAVLRALLPETGTDIKGHMRSHLELLTASGHNGRPDDFADLLLRTRMFGEVCGDQGSRL
jgi:hypothetical protein